MANSATLATLRTRVGANVDRSFSATSFVTTSQVNQWINDGLQRIHYLLANSGEDYFKSSTDVTLVAGTSSYNLPSDFYKIKGVDYISGGVAHNVPRYMVGERNKYQSGTGTDFEYRVHGTTITLIPTPGTGTLRVHYVPQFTMLSSDGTTVSTSVPEGWEDYAVSHASAKCLLKDESDASFWIAQANEQWAAMNKFFEPRDQAEPLRVVDVYSRFGSSWDDLTGER